MIRVACFGFSFYKIARLINSNPNIRMDVYLHPNDYATFKADLRETDDWLHQVESKAKNFRNLKKGRFWKRLHVSADLYLLSEDAPLFAYPKSSSRVVFLPIGFDLTVQPFPRIAIKNSKTLFGKFRLVTISIVQRRRIRSMNQIWASPFPVLSQNLAKIREDIVLDKFVPFPINYEAHNQNEVQKSLPNQLRSLDKNFLVFFPGRIMITKSEIDLTTGQTKGAEDALSGFLKFREEACPRALLVLIDQPHSPDKEIFLKLISRLGAEENVVWIKGSALNSRLTNVEMATIYQRSEVVLGDFGSGWFGQTALEAAAHGKPFISYIDPAFMSKHFGFNPFTVARTGEEVCSQLMQLFISSEQRTTKGLEMRRWYEQFLSEDVVREWYQAQISDATRPI
jgi:glycosyltransferase involved in cell wall biosynthesis